MYEETLKFATKAHGEQKRKYTGEPYITHPIAVAEIVKSIQHTEEMMAAALLHDVVEDTAVTIDEIADKFGYEVAELVSWLTNIAKASDGNRRTRKSLNVQHLSRAPGTAQTIKLADIIHNTLSIERYDPDFYHRVYRQEKIDQISVLDRGDPILLLRAQKQLGII